MTQESHWTLNSLKEYFDAVLKGKDQSINERFQAVKDAVKTAEDATKIHFTNVNEWRKQLDDQEDLFALKSENKSEHLNMNEKITEIKAALNKIENMKQGGNVVWAYVISAISLIGMITTLIINLLR